MRQKAKGGGGQWRRHKKWARKGIDLAPNPYYWAPGGEEPLSQPDQVLSLDAEDKKDPFKAA